MGNCCSGQNSPLNMITLDVPEFSLSGYKCESKVIEVYDGDTVTLGFFFSGNIFKKRCRIEGIDCAEIRTKNLEEKEYGLKTKEYVQNLLLNKIVWVEFSEDKKDKYGRLLAKIYLEKGGKSVDKMLVDDGWGYEYHGEKKRKFEEWRM